MQRTQISQEQIDAAVDMLKQKLQMRLEQKGYGTFASTHEIAGVVDEEHREMMDALRKNDVEEFKEELLDIDAILSLATATLSMPKPDISKARANIEQAREKLLNLAEGLEDSQRN